MLLTALFFCLADSHPGSLSSPPFSLHIPLLPSLFPLLSSTTSPHPIIQTILPCRGSSPTWDDEAAFHREVLSLPWICSINSIYLACSFFTAASQMEMFCREVYFSCSSQRASEEYMPRHWNCCNFFSGYGWIIDHISLKEWQLADQ